MGLLDPPSVSPTVFNAFKATVPYRPYVYDLRQFVQAGETLATDGVATGNNTAILQRALDTLTVAYAADKQPRQVFIPNGKYNLTKAGTTSGVNYAIRAKTGVGIIGESTNGTVLLAPSDSTAIFGAYGDPTKPLTDVLFQTFTIDGAAQTNATYTTQLKGFFIQYMLRPRWDRVAVRNTWATGLGCDFLQDYRIDGHISDGCGRGIRELGVSPGGVSGGSGIGLGTGYTQNERGVITGAILTNNGKNGLFYETQTSVTYHSRGHSVVGGISAGNYVGLHDCGCDGLDASGMQLIDNLFAGLLLAGTVLEPNAGFNGRFNGLIARNGSAAVADSGGVVIGSLPSGRYSIEGSIQGNTGHGVVSRTDATIGPGLRINADVRDNAGAGVLIQSTSGTPIVSLSIGGRILANGRDSSITRREGVVIAASTKNLTVTGTISDDQATPTQQIGLYLRDASSSGRTTQAANLAADPRGNVVAFKNETILDNAIVNLVGLALNDPSSLTASSLSGAAALAWTAPADTSGLTDYTVQYRAGTSGTWSTFAHTASTTPSITVTGLSNSTLYQFQVAAIKSGVTSSFSNIAATTPLSTVAQVADTFTAADGTTMAGRAAPDGTDTSRTWSYSSSDNLGQMAIKNNSLVASAGSSSGFTVIDTGLTNYRLRGTLKALNATLASRKIGMVWRYTDPQNHYRLVINTTNGAWILTKVVSGTSTTSITGPTAAAGDVFEVAVSGNTMSLTINGTLVNTATNQTGFTTSTVVGFFGQFSVDSTTAVDDFQVFTN